MMVEKMIFLSNVKIGMVVAEDVYSRDNVLLAKKNSELTLKIINRLRFSSISMIKILVDDSSTTSSGKTLNMTPKISKPSADNNVSNTINEIEQIYLPNKIQNTKEFKVFDSTLLNFTNDFETYANSLLRNNAQVDTERLLNQVGNVIEKTNNSFHLINMLTNIQRHDGYTYVHSINVSLICNAFAKWLKFSDQSASLLTLSGLLHDIGKLTITKNILDSPKKLTQDELTLIKTHPEKGYNILKNKNINQSVKFAALMHHEKIDGSGYPNNLTGANINKIAKLVSIADVYDAMTSFRPYREPICPFDVVENIEYDGYQRYDSEYLSIFLNGIVGSHMNADVLLKSGEIGKVVMINKHKLSKPIVQINNTKFIDLSTTKDNKIVRIL